MGGDHLTKLLCPLKLGGTGKSTYNLTLEDQGVYLERQLMNHSEIRAQALSCNEDDDETDSSYTLPSLFARSFF